MKVRQITEQRTCQTFLGPLPPAWDIVQLKVVSSESTDRNTDLTYGRPDVLGVDNEAGLHPSERKLGDDFIRYKLVRKNQFAYNPMRLNVRSIGLWRQDRTQLVSPDYIVFGCDQGRLAPEFLGLFMDTAGWDRQIQRSGQGSIRIRYYFHHIGDFLIPLPPVPEQRAITRALRAVQQARDARRREAALERERKAALMEHLFTHGTRGEATKQTEIGEMPESWVIANLGSFISVGPQNGLYKPQEDYGTGTPIVRIDHFNNEGAFVSLNFKRVRVSPGELRIWQLHPGDVLVNRVNSLSHLGKCAVVPSLGEPTVFESNMMRFRLDERRLRPSYLVRFLVLPQSRDRICRMAKRAVAQSSINQGNVKGFLIPVPPLDEQEEIEQILLACDCTIAALEQEIGLLDELFRALLEELMTGRLSAVPLIDAAEGGGP